MRRYVKYVQAVVDDELWDLLAEASRQTSLDKVLLVRMCLIPPTVDELDVSPGFEAGVMAARVHDGVRAGGGSRRPLFFALTEAEYEVLSRIASKLGVSRAECVRRRLGEFLDSLRRDGWSVGRVTNGDVDASARALLGQLR